MPKQYKEIILRFGELKEIKEELNRPRQAILNAIKGYFTPESKNFQSCLDIRQHILNKYPQRYRDINQ